MAANLQLLLVPNDPGANPITDQEYQNAQNGIAQFIGVPNANHQQLAAYAVDVQQVQAHEHHQLLVNQRNAILNQNALIAVIQQMAAGAPAGAGAPVANAPAAPPAAPIAAVKVPTPEIFSGDRKKSGNFLRSLKVYFRQHPQHFNNDAAKILFAISCMNDFAALWATPMKNDLAEDPNHPPARWLGGNPPANINDWPTFEQQFLAMFGDPTEREDAETKVSSLSQSTSVAAYTAEFLYLTQLLGWEDNNQTRARYFHGLKPRVQTELRLRGNIPVTLQGLIQRAGEIDSAQYSDWVAKKGTSGQPQRGGSGPRPGAAVKIHKPQQMLIQMPGVDQTGPTTQGQTRAQLVQPGTFGIPIKQEPVNAARYAQNQNLREERRRGGLCYTCGQKGHMSAQCPEKQRRANIQELAAEVLPAEQYTTPIENPYGSVDYNESF